MWDTAFQTQRIMARPFVGGFSKICELVEVQPLDAGEREMLETAVAALIYENTREFTATSLLIAAIAGIAVPRVPEYLSKQAEKKKVPRLPSDAREIPPGVVAAHQEVQRAAQ